MANFLRDREHLDYLEEPDAWHDVFGHLPLLTNPIYSRFVETLSKKVVATEETQRQKLINLYWYTIEVGLCQENGQRKAYGSALLSSFVEIQYALSNKPKVHPFDWKTVIKSNVKIDVTAHRNRVRLLRMVYSSWHDPNCNTNDRATNTRRPA